MARISYRSTLNACFPPTNDHAITPYAWAASTVCADGGAVPKIMSALRAKVR